MLPDTEKPSNEADNANNSQVLTGLNVKFD
jgi:hypothetical protein